MRKISKVKNLAGLLDLASIPQYQNGGETVVERTLPEIEVYGDQLRKDLQRTGLTYDELSNLNYGAQRQSQIQQREQGVKELAYNAPVTGDALSLYDVGKDVYEGNYGKAAIGAGLFFLPNVIEKPLERLYRFGKRAIKYINAGNRYDNAILSGGNAYSSLGNKKYDLMSEIQDMSLKSRMLNEEYRTRLSQFGLDDSDFDFSDNLNDIDSFTKRNPSMTDRQQQPNIDKMNDVNFINFLTKGSIGTHKKLIEDIVNKYTYLDKNGNRIFYQDIYENPYIKGIIESLNISGDIPDFKTGKTIHPNITIQSPKRTRKMKLSTGDVEENDSIDNAIDTSIDIPEDYVQTVRDNIDYVKKRFPGFSPFGSSVGAAYNKFPHVSGDIDGYITDIDFENQVRNKTDKNVIQDIRGGNTFRVDLFNGKFGHSGEIDFNIIKTDPKTGMAVGDNAEELFRQFFPEEYNKAFNDYIDGKPFKINRTPKELISAANPSHKTILDSFEIDFKSDTKAKHAGRAMVYLSYADPNAVGYGISKFGESLVGKNVNLANRFPLEIFSDVERNKQILKRLDLPIDESSVATDPRKMQNALDYWYLNQTVRSRSANAENLLTGKIDSKELNRNFRQWNYEGTGGTANGAGLNTVILGDSGVSAQAYGNIQATPRMPLNTNSPEEFISSVERFVGSPKYQFTNDEKVFIDSILQKYNISIDSRSYVSPEDLLNILPDRGKQVYDALKEISKKFDMPYITKSTEYGDSYYSSVIRDVDDLDNVHYTSGKNRVGSIKARKNRLNRTDNLDYLSTLNYAIDDALYRKVLDIKNTEEIYFDEYLRKLRRIAKLRIEKRKNSQYGDLYDAYKQYNQLIKQININRVKRYKIDDVRHDIDRKINKLISNRNIVYRRINNVKKTGIGLLGATSTVGLLKAIQKNKENTSKQQKEKDKQINKRLRKPLRNT